jgi:hypothetical protein
MHCARARHLDQTGRGFFRAAHPGRVSGVSGEASRCHALPPRLPIACGPPQNSHLREWRNNIGSRANWLVKDRSDVLLV